jgi:hypothetical protein
VRILLSFDSPIPTTRLDGALPKGTTDYSNEVLELIKDAKSKTAEERVGLRKEIGGAEQIERAVGVIMSGELRRSVDAAKRKKAEEKQAAAAVREVRSQREVLQHKQRLERLARSKAETQARADAEAALAARAARRKELVLWSAPVLVLSLLSLLLGGRDAFRSAYGVATVVSCVVAAGVFYAWLWMSAPDRLVGVLPATKAKSR